MTPLLEPRPATRGQTPARARRAADRARGHATARIQPRPEGGRPTLEQKLQSVWEGLHADGTAECPACHGRMELAAAGGACHDCGCELA